MAQITKIEKIYPNRDGAITKLSSLTMEYGNIVCVKYYINGGEGKVDCNCGCEHEDTKFDDEIRMIIAGYISDEPGSYFIIADSNVNTESMWDNAGFTVFQGTISNGQTPEEAIKAELFGSIPDEKDIMILRNKSLGTISTYMLIEGSWICIGDSKPDYDLNSDQFDYNPESKKLNIKLIYGGSF